MNIKNIIFTAIMFVSCSAFAMQELEEVVYEDSSQFDRMVQYVQANELMQGHTGEEVREQLAAIQVADPTAFDALQSEVGPPVKGVAAVAVKAGLSGMEVFLKSQTKNIIKKAKAHQEAHLKEKHKHEMTKQKEFYWKVGIGVGEAGITVISVLLTYLLSSDSC